MDLDQSASRVDQRGRTGNGVIAGDHSRLDASITEGVFNEPVKIGRNDDSDRVRGNQLSDGVVRLRRLSDVIPSRRIDMTMEN